MQYYNGNGPIGGRNVSQIITNVVRGLAANPKRKFSYVEQAFFQVWFETQGADVQATTKQLVANGQLEFRMYKQPDDSAHPPTTSSPSTP